MRIIAYIVFRKENMKLTKKEKEFLIDWLQEDWYLAIENDPKINSSKIILKNLKSILNKLKKENEK
tara:strand:+ start:438 stop:635 length:198 start_codon:yes stop_codon:yes gene_type:complete